MEGLEFLWPCSEELCSNTTVNIVSMKQEIVKRNLFYLIVMATTKLQYGLGPLVLCTKTTRSGVTACLVIIMYKIITIPI